jgi:meiotic recombination protein SPO11
MRNLSLSHAANAKALGKLFLFQKESTIINRIGIARYLSVLQMIYEAIGYKIIVTKRDIYYRDVSIFGSQQVVDNVSILFMTIITLLLMILIDCRRYFMSL